MSPVEKMIFGLVVGGTILATAMVFVVHVARAHTSQGGMNYLPWCCNKSDCAEVAPHAVKFTDSGWQITLNPGDHPRVTEATGRVVHLVPYTFEKRMQSTDGAFHICLFPSEKNVRCFYHPPVGS